MIKTTKILAALIMCMVLVTGMVFAGGQQEAAAAAATDTLEIVFINDGHVAPYHVAWLGGGVRWNKRPLAQRRRFA